MIVKIKGTNDVIRFPDNMTEDAINKALSGYNKLVVKPIVEKQIVDKPVVEKPKPVEVAEPIKGKIVESVKKPVVEIPVEKPKKVEVKEKSVTIPEPQIPDVEIIVTGIKQNTEEVYEIKESAREAYERVNSSIKKLQNALDEL